MRFQRVATLLSVILVAASPSSASARLISQEHQIRFVEVEDHAICGSIQVHTVYEFWAILVSTHMSPSGFPLNTMSGRYVETISDPNSGEVILKFVQTGNLFRDVKAIDNGDGTFTRDGVGAGAERMIFHGKTIDRSTGTFKYRTIIDFNGTLMDESDDQWLDFRLVFESGGPHDELNGCAFLASLRGGE